MIPIPLWFRPWMLKASFGIVLVSMIFYAGCHTQKNMDQSKINKIKSEIATIESNYDQCMDSVIRSEENYKTLLQSIEAANAETQRLHSEYQERVIALRRTGQIARDNIIRTHKTALDEANSETARLRERFQLLTVAESCHEAWEEVVK
jgi:chromosome segregation ATPase